MDDINQIIANLTPQDMEMLRGVAASILGDGGQGSAPGAASPPGAQPAPQPKPGSANSAVQQTRWPVPRKCKICCPGWRG